MKSIYFVTRLRGFFRQLISSPFISANFLYDNSHFYETNTFLKKIKNTIGRSKLFDYIGFIQVVRHKDKSCDIVGSFNRFVNTQKPYFIYVENPTALFHYRLTRGKSILGRKKIRKELNSPNLRCLIFMSKACEVSFEKICGSIPPSCISKTIYPLIPENKCITEDYIFNRSYYPECKILYVVQGMRFISKGGLEILTAFKELRNDGLNINLHIITSIKDLTKKVKTQIFQQDGIQVDDFKFSFSQLQNVYAESHILVQPTSDDSFGLTILEAMKNGLPVIASKLYSIPELITDGWNGFLCDPHYWFFDQNFIPNPQVWNHRNKTIYSGKINLSIVEFLKEKIKNLYHNRDILNNMSKNSFKRASHAPFSEEFIAKQWNEIIGKL